MKFSTFKRVLTPVMLAGFLGSASVFGATVDLYTALVNPSFELGNQPSGCPIGWTCTGSPLPGFTSYMPTTAQYTPGADGLSGGRIVPFGVAVASSPTNVEGSGDLNQTVDSLVYVPGNTYVISGYAGTPKTLPSDGVTPVAPIGTFQVYFETTGNAQLFSATLPIPAVGQYTPFSVSFTYNGTSTTQPIVLDFHADSTPVGGGSGNNRIINLDLGPAVPEPASLLLGGLGIIGVGLLGRRRRAA